MFSLADKDFIGYTKLYSISTLGFEAEVTRLNSPGARCGVQALMRFRESSLKRLPRQKSLESTSSKLKTQGIPFYLPKCSSENIEHD